MNPDDLTWTCHVCHEERPDDKISVYSSQIELASGVIMTQNVHYCNDKPECRNGAMHVNFFEGKK